MSQANAQSKPTQPTAQILSLDPRRLVCEQLGAALFEAMEIDLRVQRLYASLYGQVRADELADLKAKHDSIEIGLTHRHETASARERSRH